MAIQRRPRFVYNDGSAVDFTMALSQRPWDYGSQGVGGSDTSAAGVPASFEIRRDHFLHISLRFAVAEWGDVERLLRHFQAGGSATFYPDQLDGAITATVYGHSPAMGEEIRPRRSGENQAVLELNITLRRTTDKLFEDAYFEPAPFEEPSIALEEFDWDASLQTEANDATVSPWTDQSGNANHATVDNGTPSMLVDGWASGVRAIKLLNNENYAYDGTPFENRPATYFLVFEATDISSDLPLIGTFVSSSSPRYPTIAVRTDGRLFYNLENDPYLAVTAAGVIVQGNQYVVTVRQGSGGVVIRVNGVEKKAEPTATSAPTLANQQSVGLARDNTTGGWGGNDFGLEKRFAQFKGFSVDVTDAEMEAMENFLGQKWSVTIGA